MAVTTKVLKDFNGKEYVAVFINGVEVRLNTTISARK
jgi:hypothetical protein